MSGKSSGNTSSTNSSSSPTEDGVLLGLPAHAPEPGSTTHKAGNYHVEVSNKAGYLCHIHLKATWKVPPETIFAIFCYPDNSSIFRDIKCVGGRKVLQTEPGYKVVEVEQLGELKVLWIRRNYSTWLRVQEDSRDPENMVTRFELLKSDVLGKFGGSWSLRPIRDPATGKIIGTDSELHQDILPKGVPPYLQHIPVLGGMLRGVTVRTIQRLMEDITAAVVKVQQGQAKGKSVEQVLREMCGTCEEAGHANGPVASFQVDFQDEDEEDEEVDGVPDQVAHDAKAGDHKKLVVVGVEAVEADGGVRVVVRPAN